MRQPEYAAGFEGYNGWRTYGEPTTIERARFDLARLIQYHIDEDWLVNPSLIRRDGPNHPWELVEDSSRETATAVLSFLAEEARKIGKRPVQGDDLHRMFAKAARALNAAAVPQEYDT